jgi:hypothetical protein
MRFKAYVEVGYRRVDVVEWQSFEGIFRDIFASLVLVANSPLVSCFEEGKLIEGMLAWVVLGWMSG